MIFIGKETQGLIYEINNGQYALAANVKQRPEFSKLGKVHCQLFYDSELQNPVLDDKGEPKSVLKDFKLLKQVGFND